MEPSNNAGRIRLLSLATLVAVGLLCPSPVPAEEPAQVRGADELFWVPTLEQALDMSRSTGRPLFLMGYSLVPDGTTYTKIAEDYCSGVF